MYLESFYNYLEIEKQYSKLTVCSYKNDISQFLLYLGLNENTSEDNDFNPELYDAHDLRNWIMAMGDDNLKASTINRRISSIKSLYKYLYKKSYIKSNSMALVGSLKKTKTLPAFVKESNIDQTVFQMLEISDDYAKERQDLIFLMLYSTGMRLAELIGMNIDSLSIEQMQILVSGKGDKQRIIPIIGILKEKLKNYLFLRSEICFVEEKSLFLSSRNKRISRIEVYRIIKHQLTILGVDGKKSPHVLRHTFATHLLGRGASIESLKELLGHANLSATQIYTHSNIQQLKDVYNKAHPRANNKLKI